MVHPSIFFRWFYSSKGSTNIYLHFFLPVSISFNGYFHGNPVPSKFTTHADFPGDDGWIMAGQLDVVVLFFGPVGRW